jgi:hypothetical protein
VIDPSNYNNQTITPVPSVTDPSFTGSSSTRSTDFPSSRYGHVMMEYPVEATPPAGQSLYQAFGGGSYYPIYIFGGIGEENSLDVGGGKSNECKSGDSVV